MNDLAIKVEHISKEYRLGAIGGATLKGEIQSGIARLRRKEDPNLKIGQASHGKNERFLALKDVSFEVKKGERLAIIGHNGAGKSTLLKLICRVTAPTKGRICMNGRITSMLEVGTGFHGELTGRENIYLNGAILGMTKAEIDEKFDEIVEFSEIGQFIDTPVKRYSSGMNVKLGFSVASHLNSEIVIMDEVLAVGDVNFQNKCIARMKKLAEEEGRTILYVSHNMATVKNLCDRALVLREGQLIFDGNTENAIEVYLQNKAPENASGFDLADSERSRIFNLRHKLTRLEFPDDGTNRFEYGEKFKFRLFWTSDNDSDRVLMKLLINTIGLDPVGVVFCGELKQKKGSNESDFTFDTSFLVPGRYSVDVLLYNEDKDGNPEYYDSVPAMRFEIVRGADDTMFKRWYRNWGNAVLPCVERKEE